MRNILILITVFTVACINQETNTEGHTGSAVTEQIKRPVALQNGKFFKNDQKDMLYGGEDSTWHFDITNSILIDSQYHYGIGREEFDALIDPEFITENEAEAIYPDSAKFLFLKLGDEVKAYGIDLLTHHEVINDIVDGQPVAAAYCVLADLGAIYSRVIGGETFTFALSGYTYYDPAVWDGMDGFVWWDRETESTWWPLIGKGVSGDMLDVPLKVYDQQFWSQTTWRDIKGKFQNLMVLKPGQKMEPPKDWRTYDLETIKSIKSNESVIVEEPPRWGDNSK